MRISTRTTIAAAAAVLITAAAAYAWLGSGGSEREVSPISEVASGSGPQCCKGASADAGDAARITLDPQLFNGKVRKAYEVAQDDPALLAQIHCYCGCDKEIGHKNLLDCFRDRHGSQCDICVGEAIESERLAQSGMPIEQIRDQMRTRFGHGD